MISINRCEVPECEFDSNNRDIPYNQTWLNMAIPSANGKFDNCHRYAPRNRTSIKSSDQCDNNMFDSSREIICSKYVYTTDETNIQTEVKIVILKDSAANREHGANVVRMESGQFFFQEKVKN